jgi:hypothetical protein
VEEFELNGIKKKRKHHFPSVSPNASGSCFEDANTMELEKIT